MNFEENFINKQVQEETKRMRGTGTIYAVTTTKTAFGVAGSRSNLGTRNYMINHLSPGQRGTWSRTTQCIEDASAEVEFKMRPYANVYGLLHLTVVGTRGQAFPTLTQRVYNFHQVLCILEKRNNVITNMYYYDPRKLMAVSARNPLPLHNQGILAWVRYVADIFGVTTVHMSRDA